MVKELVENDRVIGGMSEKCSQAAVKLYKLLVTGDCVITNARTAEMAKLTENSFRDLNIAFANELSLICDELDVDVWELTRLPIVIHGWVSSAWSRRWRSLYSGGPWFLVSSAWKRLR